MFRSLDECAAGSCDVVPFGLWFSFAWFKKRHYIGIWGSRSEVKNDCIWYQRHGMWVLLLLDFPNQTLCKRFVEKPRSRSHLAAEGRCAAGLRM